MSWLPVIPPTGGVDQVWGDDVLVLVHPAGVLDAEPALPHPLPQVYLACL